MKEKRLNEVRGVILVAVGLMVLASLIRFDRLDLPFYTSSPNIPIKNLLGIFGAYLGGAIIFLFGRPTSFLIPVLILLLGVKFFRQDTPYLSIPRLIGMFVLLISIASMIGMFNLNNEFFRFYASGFFGAHISNFITAYFSRLGGFIIFSTFIILSLALVTEILISSLFLSTIDRTKSMLGIFAPLFKQERRPKATQVKVKTPPNIKIPKEVNNKKGESFDSEPKAKAPAALLPQANIKPKIQIKKPEVTEPKIRQELKIGD